MDFISTCTVSFSVIYLAPLTKQCKRLSWFDCSICQKSVLGRYDDKYIDLFFQSQHNFFVLVAYGFRKKQATETHWPPSICPTVSMERGDLVCYITLSRKPAGETLYTVHTQRHTHTHVPIVSVCDRPTKSMLKFSTMPYLTSPHVVCVCGCGGLLWGWSLKGQRSIARGWGCDRFAAELHSLFKPLCQLREHHSRRCTVVWAEWSAAASPVKHKFPQRSSLTKKKHT